LRMIHPSALTADALAVQMELALAGPEPPVAGRIQFSGLDRLVSAIRESLGGLTPSLVGAP
jgi:hypothetical protein